MRPVADAARAIDGAAVGKLADDGVAFDVATDEDVALDRFGLRRDSRILSTMAPGGVATGLAPGVSFDMAFAFTGAGLPVPGLFEATITRRER